MWTIFVLGMCQKNKLEFKLYFCLELKTFELLRGHTILKYYSSKINLVVTSW